MSYEAPTKYQGTGSYGDLVPGERAHWNEYTNLRGLSDWPGFDAAQDQRRADSRQWLIDRMDYLVELACGRVPGEEPGWDTSSRGKRYDWLYALNSGSPKHEVRLPCSESAPDTERCYIEEREVCWAIWQDTGYTTDAQEARCQANYDWLVDRRKEVWHLMEDDPDANKSNDRQTRYENLCIATRYGSYYDDWNATHNKWGEPISDSGGDSGDGGSWRDKSASWHDSHLGITESPASSNCDSRSDGIRTSQDGCANGTWLRYQPWCGCWAWSGLYAGGRVKKGDSWLASVASIEDYARAGNGPFKGWTTDGGKAKKGDLVILFGRGQHVGTVRSVDSSYCHTWEGNTSGGSGGSQSNGGGSYKRSRSRSGETYGYALVKD
jgi:hypothetical protein